VPDYGAARPQGFIFSSLGCGDGHRKALFFSLTRIGAGALGWRTDQGPAPQSRAHQLSDRPLDFVGTRGQNSEWAKSDANALDGPLGPSVILHWVTRFGAQKASSGPAGNEKTLEKQGFVRSSSRLRVSCSNQLSYGGGWSLKGRLLTIWRKRQPLFYSFAQVRSWERGDSNGLTKLAESAGGVTNSGDSRGNCGRLGRLGCLHSSESWGTLWWLRRALGRNLGVSLGFSVG
jgi:hypothetical protein